MAAQPREVELKFRLPAGAGPRLLVALGSAPAIERLESVYFDTARCALRGRGLSLRVRHEDGQWRQTIKSAAASGGRLGRGEWESLTADDAPDLAHARGTPAAGALRGAARLAPRFTVLVDRQTVTVGAVACSLDHGEVRVGRRTQAFDELELELKHGDPSALFDLARELSHRFELDLSFTAKADRGYALIKGPAHAPCRFVAPSIEPSMTTAEAFRAVARAALEQIARNVEPLCQAPCAEAVHQMRVGARRMRAGLKSFAEVTAGRGASEVAADLKWLGAELDQARNLDVFLEGVWRRAASGATDERIAAAEARLRLAREGAYARAIAAARSPRLRVFLLDALIWIETGDWSHGPDGAAARDEPAVRFARRALSRLRRKVLKRGRGLKGLSREARHHLRIGAKELRYAADVLSPVFQDEPQRTQAFVERLKDLLDDLGELNDIATGEALAADYPPADEVIVAKTHRERRLVAEAAKSLAAFEDAKPFWKT